MPSCAKPRRRSRRSASPPTALPPAGLSRSTSSAGPQGTAQGADDAVLQVALAARGEAVTRLLDEMLAPVAGPRGRVIEAMRYSALGGGKRLRPFLVCESARLFEVPEARALRVAAAIEMVHCYSLIHDDLPAMDDRIGRAHV